MKPENPVDLAPSWPLVLSECDRRPLKLNISFSGYCRASVKRAHWSFLLLPKCAIVRANLMIKRSALADKLRRVAAALDTLEADPQTEVIAVIS